MKKLLSLIAVCVISTVLYADECEATYGVASVTFTRDGAVYQTGHFSVSETKSVKFSPANLAYNTGRTVHFYFLQNQYSYTHNSDGVVDLFAYGSSGYNGTNPDGDVKVTGNINDTDYDWGVYNAITSYDETKTYPAGTWRTLTWDEWHYLSSLRTNHALLISGAKVAGIYGIILLPDDWVEPDDLPAFEPSFAFTDVGSVNTYNAEQWTIFENAGAIFLPAVCNSGCSAGTGEAKDAYCSYMSATQYNDDDVKRADFGNNDRVIREVDASKSLRSSVRLVQDW